MQAFREAGYKKYDSPPTSSADELWQKRVDAAGRELYVNAHYYGSRGHRKPEPTVEFLIQNDEIEHTMNLKLFGFTAKDLTGVKIKKVEMKLRNMYIYSFYA